MENSLKSQILLYINDEDKEEFSKLSNPKDKLELFWSHKIFDNIFENKDCFESEKDEESGELAAIFADEMFKEGNFPGALEFYNRGVILSKNKSDNFKKCLVNRSACLCKLKKPDLAIQDCDILIKEKGQDEKTFTLLERKIKCLILKKDFERAKDGMEELKQSLDKNHSSAQNKQIIVKSLEQTLKKYSEKQGNDKEKEKETENNPSICIPEDKRHPIFEAGSNLFDIIYTEAQGRHAVATRDINVGEVIVRENPIAAQILPAHHFSHCHNCWSVLEAPLPCPSCTLAVYCSPACIAAHQLHSWECGNKMLMNMEHSRISFQMITHFGMEHILNLGDKLETPDPKWAAAQCENTSEKVKVYASDDLENAFHHQSPNLENIDQLGIVIQTIFLLKCLQRKQFFVNCDFSQILETGKLMMHLTTILPSNAHGIGKMIIKKTPLPDNQQPVSGINQEVIDRKVNSFGVGLYNTLSLFNHSCNPSFVRFNQGKQVICVATRNIKKGSELYENYGVSCLYHTKEFRQKNLLDRYGFLCTCAPCTQDWTVGAESSDKERNVMLTLYKAIVQKMWINNGNKQFM